MDIANQGNADRMMVSKVLRTLEEKKFISRLERPSDTRAKAIRLTNECVRVLQKALTAVENTDINFFSVLGNELSLSNKDMTKLTEENKD